MLFVASDLEEVITKRYLLIQRCYQTTGFDLLLLVRAWICLWAATQNCTIIKVQKYTIKVQCSRGSWVQWYSDLAQDSKEEIHQTYLETTNWLKGSLSYSPSFQFGILAVASLTILTNVTCSHWHKVTVTLPPPAQGNIRRVWSVVYQSIMLFKPA
jgi:hypothetical protein